MGGDLRDMSVPITWDIILPPNVQATLGCGFDIACFDGKWDVGGLKELLACRRINALRACARVTEEDVVELPETAVYSYRQSFGASCG